LRYARGRATAYIPLLDRRARPARKSSPASSPVLASPILAGHVDGRDYLLDRFGVADAYLVTVLNWSPASGTDLAGWPAVDAYCRRVIERLSVAHALAEERALYAEEQRRAAA
jgi:glutathione S-transferase